jgi:hypothetical protein
MRRRPIEPISALSALSVFNPLGEWAVIEGNGSLELRV